jgi:hypothetical protein
MIGHCHGGLAKSFDLADERFNLIGAVEETELGMEVQVRELGSHGA